MTKNKDVVRPVLKKADYENARLGAAIRAISPTEYIALAVTKLLEQDRKKIAQVEEDVLCGTQLHN